MNGFGAGVRVYLACGITDLRKGITGLAALAQQVLHQNPASSGSVLAFRGRRVDGQGFCLYYKVLEQGRFPWPSPADGVARRPQDNWRCSGRGSTGGVQRGRHRPSRVA